MYENDKDFCRKLGQYLTIEKLDYTVSIKDIGNFRHVFFDFEPPCDVLTDFLDGDLRLLFKNDIIYFDGIMMKNEFSTWGNAYRITLCGEYVDIEFNILGFDDPPPRAYIRKNEFVRIVHEYIACVSQHTK